MKRRNAFVTFYLNTKSSSLVNFHETWQNSFDDQGKEIRSLVYKFDNIKNRDLRAILFNMNNSDPDKLLYQKPFDIAIPCLNMMLKGCTVIDKNDTEVFVKATGSDLIYSRQLEDI